MRLLDRYLFRELFAPLAVCLIGIQSLVAFSIVFSDAGKIQDAKMHFFGTMAYIGLASTEYLAIVLPVSELLGILWALSYHARHNEITAMRAAGISLWRICVPYFIVGLAASGALFALNEFVTPWSLNRATQMVEHSSRDTSKNHVSSLGLTNERGHRIWIIGDYNLDTTEMVNPQVVWVLPDGPNLLLRATRAIWTNNVWTFFNLQELSNSPTGYLPMLQTNIPVKAMPEFDETPGEIRNDIAIRSYLSFNPDLPLADILAYLRWHPDLPRSQKSRLLTEFHSRISTPLTCLVVALIAIPFGAAPGRRNVFFGVAGSIFIFFAYYVLQHVSLAFGSNDAWPAWLAAWVPNLFFLSLGLILTMRIR